MSANKILVMKFTKIVGSIVGISLMIISVLAYGYITHANNAFANHLLRAEAAERAEFEELLAATGELPFQLGGDEREMISAPARTTFMVLGLDVVASLADVIIAGVFNHSTLEISLISIPRDTFVQLSSATVREMQASGGFPPSHGGVRINAIHNYSRNRDDGIRFMRQELENLLGFSIDYYFVMNVAGFRSIVDALGGVTINVPQRMFYNPYDQDLIIDLHPGVQHLNGAQAEGFVRFRNHPAGDIFRIQNQQKFMSALFSQALTRENIMNNAFELARAILENTTTDFGITDIPRYIRYATSLSSDVFSTHSLPSARPAGSFFWHDPLQTRLLVDGIFWDGEVNEDGSRVFAKENLRVNVVNGGAVSGLAGARQEMLLENGFVYVDTDSFDGARRSYTRIISYSDEPAEILAEYFPHAVIERADIMNRALIGSNDVVVIIGLDER